MNTRAMHWGRALSGLAVLALTACLGEPAWLAPVSAIDVGEVVLDSAREPSIDGGGVVDVTPDPPVGLPRDAGPDRAALPDVTGDVGPSIDVPTMPAVTGVPRIDGALKAALRAVVLRGQAAGWRADVFAKVGDSITDTASFLRDFGPSSGTPSWDLGAFVALEPTRAYFDATLVDETHSSFDRLSLAAVSSWTSVEAMEDDGVLLRQELAALRPAVAIVMLGSADIGVTEVDTFRVNLTRIVQIMLAANVIPVLSTIPDRTDSPTAVALGPSFNLAIREVAAEQHLPLEDYWTALQPLANHGVSEDGMDPSIYHLPDGRVEAAYFTPAALSYGYNVRNLLTLATLAHVRTVVFDDGPPDP